ncbi:hypothetical protein BKA70DRAFT_1453551 [Coprinopsis sp. MPI-PUGE-AT-0042]|nr:hypothetical protein BKA70DRAFT_1453551 [Coprinopsis sp. MPI-PUGE-AT-0042]
MLFDRQSLSRPAQKAGKLRKEAPDQVKKIHELVSQTMAALSRAETREKVEIEAARLQAEVKATEATTRAVEAEQMVARLEAEAEARNRLLAQLVSSLTPSTSS